MSLGISNRSRISSAMIPLPGLIFLRFTALLPASPMPGSAQVLRRRAAAARTNRERLRGHDANQPHASHRGHLITFCNGGPQHKFEAAAELRFTASLAVATTPARGPDFPALRY